MTIVQPRKGKHSVNNANLKERGGRTSYSKLNFDISSKFGERKGKNK